MNIKLTAKFIASFILLTFLMQEAHEIIHTSIGRIICGCWGTRDFNGWSLCEGCIEKNPLALISTFAGPIFTFTIIFIGAFFLKESNTNKQKSLGLALIFSNIPFARILSAIFGGGDEVFGLSFLIKNFNVAWIIGLSSIILITSYPLYKSYKTILNKNRIGYFSLLFLTPTLINLIVLLGLMNTLLNNNILSDYWILGSPVLVTLWTLVVTIIFIVTKRQIFTLGDKNYA